MRIEMCGPPTAGKSQLVKELVKAGIQRGPKKVTAEPPKKWSSFSDFIRHAYSVKTFKKLPIKTLMSLSLADIGDKYSGHMVFDELVILCGFSMAIRFPKEYPDRYFAEAPLPGALIYLTADVNTLLERNLARGEKNRPEKTMRMVHACDQYIPVLKERGCNILTFDTTRTSTTEIVKKIKEELR